VAPRLSEAVRRLQETPRTPLVCYTAGNAHATYSSFAGNNAAFDLIVATGPLTTTARRQQFRRPQTRGRRPCNVKATNERDIRTHYAEFLLSGWVIVEPRERNAKKRPSGRTLPRSLRRAGSANQ